MVSSIGLHTLRNFVVLFLQKVGGNIIVHASGINATNQIACLSSEVAELVNVWQAWISEHQAIKLFRFQLWQTSAGIRLGHLLCVMADNSKQATTSNINYKCLIAIRHFCYMLRYDMVQTTTVTNLTSLNRDLHWRN